MLKSLLASTSYRCTSTINGQDAINIICSRPMEFDLILLDINMPTIDGLEVAKLIKRRGSATEWSFRSRELTKKLVQKAGFYRVTV